MSCHDFQDWLQRRLDGEMLPLPDGLEPHLAGCLSCRSQQHAAQLLLEGVQGLKQPSPPSGLTDAIVARVLADRRERSFRRRRRVAATVALAASLLLAALAGYLWLPQVKTVARDDVEKTPQAQFSKPQDESSSPGGTDVPSLAGSVEEARSAVASLTEKLADKGKEQARLWWSVAPLDMPKTLPKAKLEQPLDPAARSLRQTGQGMTEGLTTVTQSARRAVSYFFRELSPLETSKSGS